MLLMFFDGYDFHHALHIPKYLLFFLFGFADICNFYKSVICFTSFLSVSDKSHKNLFFRVCSAGIQ